MAENEKAIIVVNKTRLERLIERFNTKAQSRFYIERSGGDFDDYQLEHDTFKKALDEIVGTISRHVKCQVLDRQYLPNYIFTGRDLVVVVGQDGLVANTAKYVKGQPMLAINPDPSRYDGILLPFTVESLEGILPRALEGKASNTSVTMAEVNLNDGQRLLAFNDFFIGHASHVSARYKITFGKTAENQSSSGIIVSTGAGSTGWMSSVFNMANGLLKLYGDAGMVSSGVSMPVRSWAEKRLLFAVREPFASKYSQAGLTMGMITKGKKLVVESYMPTNGVIFSDGIEADYLKFNSGFIAEIGVAEQCAAIIRR